MTLTLRPYTLSQSATNIRFRAGDKLISYAHGPRTPVMIEWPFSSEELSSAVVLTDFNHQHFSVHATGIWALFKILNHPGFSLYQSGGHSLLRINLHHHVASYTIDSSTPIADLKLLSLTHFRLPKSL